MQSSRPSRAQQPPRHTLTYPPSRDTHSALSRRLPSLSRSAPPHSAVSRPHVGLTSALSRLYLGSTSALSRLHLGSISAVARRVASPLRRRHRAPSRAAHRLARGRLAAPAAHPRGETHHLARGAEIRPRSAEIGQDWPRLAEIGRDVPATRRGARSSRQSPTHRRLRGLPARRARGTRGRACLGPRSGRRGEASAPSVRSQPEFSTHTPRSTTGRGDV